MGTPHEYRYKFSSISRSVLFRMRNVSDKNFRKNQNTYFVLNIFFFFSENCALVKLYEKNIVQLDRPQMAIWHMYFACWMTKATNTDSGYVILIAFPRQQCFLESTSMLPYTYITCRVKVFFHLHQTISVASSLQVLQKRILYLCKMKPVELYMLLQLHAV
jgi:hypothetical protein